MVNREFDIALTYHQETKHTYDSIYRTHHFLDWDNQPRPYKTYPQLRPLPLPQHLPTTHMSLFQALSLKIEPLASAVLPSLDEIAYLLFYAAGVTKQRHYPNYGEMWFRAAACTGALYHIDLYLAVPELDGLPAGIYHFDPITFALRQLRAGDYRRVLVEASGSDGTFQEAPVMIVAADTFWRNAWKYRARAYRHSFWDSGTILANLLVAATGLERPTQFVTGFVDTAVNTLFGLDPDREAAIWLAGIGHGSLAPADPPVVETLEVEVAPLSAQEADYPAIRITHQASMLADAREVQEWRQEAPLESLAPESQALLLLEPGSTPADDGIEAVIRRRGSARQFERRDMTPAELAHILHWSAQNIPADYVGLSDVKLNHLYLLVHAVEGLPPGAYVYHPQEVALELLAEGDYRDPAGAMALGQELAADASVNVYFLCDLTLILEQFGNRGYRIAQLEAGIVAGRMYLAAYAQQLGATGLTFFDDEVVEMFSPHAAEKSVMFLLAIGHPASRRQS